MISRHVTRWSNSFPTTAAAVVLAWCTVFATEAGAACFAGEAKGPANAPKAEPRVRALPIGDSDSPTVVGMWHATFYLGDVPIPAAVIDDTFQQFGSDGMENIISNGLPPILGNVCIGVWKQEGYRTYKLFHTTWNWGPEPNEFFPTVPGKFAGTFQMFVTLRVSRDGKSYSGRWAASNFDPSGTHLPALDANGVVNATRITVP